MNSHAPTLRPKVNSDNDFLMDLFKASTDSQINALMPVQLSQQLLQSQFTLKEQSYAQMYPDGKNNIIDILGTSVGRFFINISHDEIRLVDIAILPKYRNQGIGTFLIQHLLSDAIEIKKPVRLQVLANNIEAQRLYNKLGFIVGYNDGVNISCEYIP